MTNNFPEDRFPDDRELCEMETLLRQLTPCKAPRRLRAQCLAENAQRLAEHGQAKHRPLPTGWQRVGRKLRRWAAEVALIAGAVSSVWVHYHEQWRDQRLFGPDPLPRSASESVADVRSTLGDATANELEHYWRRALSGQPRRDPWELYRKRLSDTLHADLVL